MIKFHSVILFCLVNFNMLAQQELKVGELAPKFESVSHDGELIDLDSLLKKGPVVLFFYRGSWCPFCNKQMSELQDSLYLLKEKSAIVLAISPETDQSMNKIIDKTDAEFIFMSDTTYKIMNDYHVSFVLDESTRKKYKLFGLDVEEANGNDQFILAVPATYIIGKDGKIVFSYFEVNYKKRVSVKKLLSILN